MNTPKPIADVLNGAPSLFLSPHLDDAVLSCGLVLRQAAAATVATVFTEATPGPHTRAARSFLRQCGATEGAEELFARRRAEDVEVVTAAGASAEHLGRRDALFRVRRGTPGLLGRLVPELVHRYPTFRFDIARARVAAAERDLPARIAEQVTALVGRTGAEVVFCPLGVGRHVDHVLVRSVGPELAARVVYYADFPYTLHSAPDQAFLDAHRLRRWECPQDPADKRELIEGYRSQVDALFPDGEIPPRAEEYYLAS